MRAAIQERYGAGALRVREVSLPAQEAGRLRVRVLAASLNAADGHYAGGSLPVRMLTRGWTRPKVPVRGLDLAGIVESVGPEVARSTPGDEVFGTAVGTLAEYVSAREDHLWFKPSALSFESAAAAPLAGVTALQGLRDKARVQRGQKVLIYGAGGGVGTFAVQIAKALGAHVTAVTGPRNLQTVRSLGADEVVDYSREDVTSRPTRYDVFFDVAAVLSIPDCLRVLAPDGVLVMAGAPRNGAWRLVVRMAQAGLRSRSQPQRIVSYMARSGAADLRALAELMSEGLVTPIIDRVYPLEAAGDALRYVMSGRARAKVVIRVAGGPSGGTDIRTHSDIREGDTRMADTHTARGSA